MRTLITSISPTEGWHTFWALKTPICQTFANPPQFLRLSLSTNLLSPWNARCFCVCSKASADIATAALTAPAALPSCASPSSKTGCRALHHLLSFPNNQIRLGSAPRCRKYQLQRCAHTSHGRALCTVTCMWLCVHSCSLPHSLVLRDATWNNQSQCLKVVIEAGKAVGGPRLRPASPGFTTSKCW